MKKLLIALLLLGILTACGTPASVDGSWALDMNGETVVWTFSEGEITFSYNGETTEEGGVYEYADGILRINLKEDWSEYADYECTLRGNRMTLTQEGVEDKLVFTKVED